MCHWLGFNTLINSVLLQVLRCSTAATVALDGIDTQTKGTDNNIDHVHKKMGCSGKVSQRLPLWQQFRLTVKHTLQVHHYYPSTLLYADAIAWTTTPNTQPLCLHNCSRG